MCNIYFLVLQARIPAKSSVPNRAPARAMSSSGASADVEFEAVLSDQPQGPGETRPQNQVRGPALLCSADLARFCQWSRSRRRSSISWRRSSRFAFISARSWQAQDLRLQDRNLQGQIGSFVFCRVHFSIPVSRGVAPAPLQGRWRRPGTRRSSVRQTFHQPCAPFRIRSENFPFPEFR
jgi:hypothetical protein